MPCLSGNGENQAVGESEGRTGPEIIERFGDDVRILKDQEIVFEQQRDRVAKFRGGPFVDRSQHPDGLGKHEMGYPRTARNELARQRSLFRVVLDEQTDQDVRVNRAHVWRGYSA